MASSRRTEEVVNNVVGAVRTAQPPSSPDATTVFSGWWVRSINGTTNLAGNSADVGARVPSSGLVVGLDGAITKHLFLWRKRRPDDAPRDR